ncbi:MAG TPA: amidohydrolase family protein [Candidatus Aquilonibacter sp.]|nr:amidohydrolase family protein [Candidatus Aquilonibacter sp.]
MHAEKPAEVLQWFVAECNNRGRSETFYDGLRQLHFDTVLDTAQALELLIETAGADRCVFGTEGPGVGAAKHLKTGKPMDDVNICIDGFDWLGAADKNTVFEDNAKRLFRSSVDARGEKASPAGI